MGSAVSILFRALGYVRIHPPHRQSFDPSGSTTDHPTARRSLACHFKTATGVNRNSGADKKALSFWLHPSALRTESDGWINQLITRNAARIVRLQFSRAGCYFTPHPEIPGKSDQPKKHASEKEGKRPHSKPVSFQLDMRRIERRPGR